MRARERMKRHASSGLIRWKRRGLSWRQRRFEILHELLDRRGGRIEHRLRTDAVIDGQENKRRQDGDLPRRQVENALQARLLDDAEDDAAIEVERIASREDHARRREEGDPGVRLERA